MAHVPVRVNTLRGDQKISFDLYVKVADKLILYIRSGDSFEGPRLQRFKDKKIKKLFIRPEDEAGYRAYVQKNLDLAYDNKSPASIETRAEIIQGQQQTNVEEVFQDPASVELYTTAKSGAAQYAQFLTTHKDGFKAIFALENQDRSLTQHGTSVANLAVALAGRMGISDEKTMQMLTLGSLLHDFGHRDQGLHLLKASNDLTPNELAAYRKHPSVGSEELQGMGHFDPDIITMIAQHEECVDGSGYPRGLTERDLDPSVVMLSTCNALDRMIAFENIPKQEAGKKMMLTRVGKHPLSQIQHLIEILKSAQ